MTPTNARSRRLRLFVFAIWFAFVCRGAVHALMAPMWDGFDEPFHLALVDFIADHGRPPGFKELSFPHYIVDANRQLPSAVGFGAPTFAQWRALSETDRAEHRAVIDRQTRTLPASERQRYMGANYERQQGPVFYYLAAPVSLVTRQLPLPERVVLMRLFCVLLASLAVPLTAQLLREIGGARMLIIGLPFAALLPNTAFFVHRITNDVVTWTLMPLALLLVLRMRRRRASGVAAGTAIAAGIWTKLTFVPAIAAPLAVAAEAWLRKRADLRRAVIAVAIPLVATAILFSWNYAASGTLTGLAETTATRYRLNDLVDGVATVFTLDWWQRLLEMHAWSGGWGFVKPSRSSYNAVLGTLLIVSLCGIVAALRDRGRRRELRRMLPLIAVAVAFVAAMIQHGVGGAIAAARVPGFPQIGAEGWYVDLLRPIEAALFAIVFSSLLKHHAVRAASLLPPLLLALDLALTSSLMWRAWSGGAAGDSLYERFIRANDAAPLVHPLIAALLLAATTASVMVAAVAAARLRLRG